jgi:hypothetical protein
LGKQTYSSIVELERELHEVVEAVDVTKHVTGTPDRLTLTTQRGDIEADGGLAHLLYDLRVVGGETLERFNDRELHQWELEVDLLYQVSPGHDRAAVYDQAVELVHDVVRSLIASNSCLGLRMDGPPSRSWVTVRGRPSSFLRVAVGLNTSNVFISTAAA